MEFNINELIDRVARGETPQEVLENVKNADVDALIERVIDGESPESVLATQWRFEEQPIGALLSTVRERAGVLKQVSPSRLSVQQALELEFPDVDPEVIRQAMLDVGLL